MILQSFLAGAITLGYFVAALLFFRARKRSGDPLFLAFGTAFCILGVGQGLGALTTYSYDELSWVFLLRLAAYLMIIVAIIGKNVGTGARRP